MMNDADFDDVFHGPHVDGFRIIQLRRPPVVSMVEEPYVPSTVSLEEVDRRWSALCASNSAYFDGTCLHVIGVHRNGYGGAVIHVAPCSYRFYAVQDESFDFGMRGLGVKGMVERDGALLFGERATNMAFMGGIWELAPGGAVEPEATPAATILAELEEETSLTSAVEPVAEALVFDPSVRTWEVVYRLRDVVGEATPSPEYTALAWRRPEEAPGPLTPIARRILEWRASRDG